MGFIRPAPPPFDVQEWKRKPHLERIKPLAQDWTLNGFGTPGVVYLLYVAKLFVYSLGAVLVISTTPGLGDLGDFGDWWSEPIVFQKLVAYTILWELIGLGSGSGPLTFRFTPPFGASLYWLRPGTIRLPPWPDKVPFTRGTRRTVFDVAVFAALLVSLAYLLFSGTAPGRLDPAMIGVTLGLLGVMGLRDKVSYLCARPEVYGAMLVMFLFPFHDLIVGAQLVMVSIWLGAAASKLTPHFPYVVSIMISNTPWNRSKAVKRRLYKNHPSDLRPSRLAFMGAHLGTVIEGFLPLCLLFTQGGRLGWIAAAGMVVFHGHILSTIPAAVPLEWNIFMIFGTVFLFGHYGDVPLSTLDSPLLIAILLATHVVLPIVGNVRPDKVSFLHSMRYYAGNWAASHWLFNKDSGAEEKLSRCVVKSAPLVVEQMTRLYDRDAAEVLLTKGLAFRELHAHGRALNGLLPRAVDDVENYDIRDGEFQAGALVGWNFGDGHFHHKQLLDAVQERCQYEPGELRVVFLESQPIHLQRQHYCIYDAALGLIEEGEIAVADMTERQPWLDETATIPVSPVRHSTSVDDVPAIA